MQLVERLEHQHEVSQFSTLTILKELLLSNVHSEAWAKAIRQLVSEHDWPALSVLCTSGLVKIPGLEYNVFLTDLNVQDMFDVDVVMPDEILVLLKAGATYNKSYSAVTGQHPLRVALMAGLHHDDDGEYMAVA